MYASDIPISTGSGWANIQLGNTITEVRAALATNGHPYERSDDDLVIDIHSPEITFYFDDSNPRNLVQIVFYDQDHRVNEQPVIGLTLAEALLAFNVQSFDDTLWSLVSIEEEFPKGKPLTDAQRIRQASSETKLESGTLWVKSQGIGLVMLFGFVHAIAMRKVGSEPTVGCGRLDSQVMEMSLAQEPTRKPEKTRKINPEHWPNIPSRYFTQDATPPSNSTSKSSWSRKKTKYIRSVVFSILAVFFLALPVQIVYRDLTAWEDSKAVVGRVVSTKPEGPFPDEIVIEYAIGETNRHQVTIPSTYTTAREIDEEVEMLYLPNQPARAMTRIQIRDEGWSISPYLLFGSIGIAAVCLQWAFPNHIRLNGRRSIGSR